MVRIACCRGGASVVGVLVVLWASLACASRASASVWAIRPSPDPPGLITRGFADVSRSAPHTCTGIGSFPLSVLNFGGCTVPCPESADLAPQPAPESFDRAVGLAAMWPLGLRAVASKTIGAAQRRYWVAEREGSMFASSGGISSFFASSGLRLRTSAGTLAISVDGVGHGDGLRRVRVGSVSGRGSSVVYRHGPLTEWYRTGPFGLEQGFVVRSRPRGLGHLVVGLRTSGSLRPHHSGSDVTFTGRNDSGLLSYGALSATDATGRDLPAWIELRRGQLLIWVDDRRARYPVRIDPFFQQGAKLAASDESGAGNFGSSIALASDGSTALIGGPDSNAAWVFTRSGTTWTQQGSALTVAGAIGFGGSVALSSDGSTALIGATGVNSAYVFSRSGSTWTQQGGAITPDDAFGNSSFGASVALSSDGNTALIGGDSESSQALFAGAAWVFTRSGSTWTQQGSKLTGTGETGGAAFGNSVALSSDGNTALIGGETDNSNVGAAWVFTRSGSSWAQQDSKLIGGGEVGAQNFGTSVALSADGNTALIGGSGYLNMLVLDQPSSPGAAWVFMRSGSTWTQQGSELTVSEATQDEQFGASVALSSDGNTAIIGGPGTGAGAGGAWAFMRSGSAWAQLGARLSVSDGSGPLHFGSGVAISGDGSLALVSGPGDNSNVGAAWGFLRLPVVSTVSPAAGPPGGGTVVTITGADLNGATGVKFGSAPAASFTVDSSTQITATSPAGSLGPVDITVADAQGTSPVNAADEFAFATPPGAPTSVTAVPGARQATVQFTAPSANGSPVTGYTVTASPGGASASGTTSPITVTGLGDSTAYTFTVTATNAAGTGPSSEPSASVRTKATTQTALTADQDRTFYGTPLTFTATISSVQAGASTPTGTANFTVTGEDPVPEAIGADGKAAFSPPYYLNVGDTVTVGYGGDAAHDVSTTTLAPTIKPAVTTMSLTASQNPATTGVTVTITATVTNTSTTAVPFGTIHFVADGQPLDVPLDANGEAIIDVSRLEAGDHTITATYHDDTGPAPDFTDSQASLTEHINPPPPPPVNTGLPAISGVPEEGQMLTEAHGTWTNNPTAYGYRWGDCDTQGNNCTPIAGAIGQTYVLTANDVGHSIAVQETATNQTGMGAPASSIPTAVVTLLIPSNLTKPTISGAPRQGQTLSLTHGSWSTNAPTISDEWQDCDSAGNNCTVIAGATDQTYGLTASDVGHTIRVVEVASNAGGSSSPATSAATGVVEVSAGTKGVVAIRGVKVAGLFASATGSCAGEPGATCNLIFTLSVVELMRDGTVIGVIAKANRTRAMIVSLGSSAAILSAGQRSTVQIRLNGIGRRLLASRHTLRVKLAAVESSKTVSSTIVTFRAKPARIRT